MHKDVANFFRNTQKLTPIELKTIVHEIIKNEIKEEIQRFLLTNKAQQLIKETVKNSIYEIKPAIAKLALEYLLEQSNESKKIP